jgi:serine/threonine protein phosphatase PrpC
MEAVTRLVDRPPWIARLLEAAQTANATLVERAEAARRTNIDRQWLGISATLVAAAFVDGYAYVVHVGDARVHRSRGGQLMQLTRDHSLGETMRALRPQPPESEIDLQPKKALTSALEMPGMIADLFALPLVEGDVFILSSDALTDFVPPEEILATLAGAGAGFDPENVAQALIRRALVPEHVMNDAQRDLTLYPFRDNVTAVIATVERDASFH